MIRASSADGQLLVTFANKQFVLVIQGNASAIG
jgi:hypothetical protein